MTLKQLLSAVGMFAIAAAGARYLLALSPGGFHAYVGAILTTVIPTSIGVVGGILFQRTEFGAFVGMLLGLLAAVGYFILSAAADC